MARVVTATRAATGARYSCGAGLTQTVTHEAKLEKISFRHSDGLKFTGMERETQPLRLPCSEFQRTMARARAPSSTSLTVVPEDCRAKTVWLSSRDRRS